MVLSLCPWDFYRVPACALGSFSISTSSHPLHRAIFEFKFQDQFRKVDLSLEIDEWPWSFPIGCRSLSAVY